MFGYTRWPVPSNTTSRLLLLVGPGTRSYSTPVSISAFSTRQHGCALIFTHCCEQRCNFTAIPSSLLRRRRASGPARARRAVFVGRLSHIGYPATRRERSPAA